MKVFMILRTGFILIFFMTIMINVLMACELVGTNNNFFYYCFPRGCNLPQAFCDSTKKMYYESYNPVFHKDYSTEQMGLDRKFKTYEQFLHQLIEDDFTGYNTKLTNRVVFFVTQRPFSENVEPLGVAVFLDQDQKGEYYIDHIGIQKEFQRKGIGHQLLKFSIQSLGNVKKISLDTRVFNRPGNEFYQKELFNKMAIHPNEHKEGRYYRYTKTYN